MWKFKIGLILILVYSSKLLLSQEVIFFSEGTGSTYYDQGIVDVNNLGSSYFEHTFPPGYPQYNDKVPCSTTAYQGSTSLKFNYTSSSSGNWKVSIYRSGWSSADISNMDSISFYIYSETELQNTALPQIGIQAAKTDGSGDRNSKLYQLSEFNNGIPASEWTKISFPISVLKNDTENAALNLAVTKGIIFNQSENDNSSRLILIDELKAYISLNDIPLVEDLSVIPYDSHVELNWTKPLDNLSYRIYASFDNSYNFLLRGETTEDQFLDFFPEPSRNTSITYRIITVVQNEESDPQDKTVSVEDFTDDELLDMVQEYSFRYFWEGAHQASGMALERSTGTTTVASGATGMGLMAMIVAHEREYKPKDEIKDRILLILNFLETCDRHHGAWSHWYNGDTKKTQPFSEKDDGGDIVETSFVAQSLIALKNYFTENDEKSTLIRNKADQLWKDIDWNWYQQDGQNVLYWHWSPNYNFEKNMKVQGWDECLGTYLMAASSPTHAISKQVYEEGWAQNGSIVNNRKYYGFKINLSPNWGGPLFWIHYTHLGINPKNLIDQYADYWQEHVNTAKIHHAYSVANPMNHTNYSDKCWGLTASDDPYGYTAHKPIDNDNGTISPTAALASMPYTPEETMKAIKYFYRERGSELFGKYGPYDAFNDKLNWVKESYIGIDQGPIVVMIENYRTGLLWNQVMKDEDVQAGLDKLGFQYQVYTSNETLHELDEFKIFPNPASNNVFISLRNSQSNQTSILRILSIDGKIIKKQSIPNSTNHLKLDCSELKNGLYLISIEAEGNLLTRKLIIQK